MPKAGEQKAPSIWDNAQVSQYLEKNFERFSDPQNNSFITRNLLQNIAYPRRNSDVTPEETTVARELLIRHDLMDKLDAGGGGKLDEKIDRATIRTVIQGDGASKAGSVSDAASANMPDLSKWSDSQITQYLGKHFNTFMDNDAKPGFLPASWDSGDKEFVTRASLERVAHSAEGQFTPIETAFARELLKRTELLSHYEDPNDAIVDGFVSKRDVYDQLAVKRVNEGKTDGGDYNQGTAFTTETFAVYGEDGDLLMKDRYTKHGDFGGARWTTEFF